jgi:hypothetical protein
MRPSAEWQILGGFNCGKPGEGRMSLLSDIVEGIVGIVAICFTLIAYLIMWIMIIAFLCSPLILIGAIVWMVTH